MRILIPTTLTVALGLSFSQLAMAITVTTEQAPIKNVTLYPNVALVERSIVIPQGEQQLVLTGLPANFDMSLLQVSATAGIDVGQIVSKDRPINQPISQSALQLTEKIDQLQDEMNRLDAQIKAGELQTRYLDRLTAPVQGSTAGNTAISGVKSVYQNAFDAFETIRIAQKKKSNLEKQLALLQADLEDIGSVDVPERKVTIALDAKQTGTITLSYQTENASWQPFYKASLSTQNDKMILERMATISQQTGEDWTKAKIKLSTGSPDVNMVAPTPEPWQLEYHEPVQALPMKAMAVAMPAPAPVMASDAFAHVRGDSDEKKRFKEPVQINSAFTTEFIIGDALTIPSSQQETAVSLSKQELATTKTVRVVPKQSTFAVLTATVKQPEGVYPSGIVKLYRDNDYVGEAQWEENQDKLAFSFGKDDLIQVKVIDKAKKTNQTGVFKGGRQRLIDKQYQVINRHQTPIHMTLLESTPQSESSEISVEQSFSKKVTTENWEDISGVMAFEQLLQPKETFSLEVHYQIKYPNEGYVSGLP